MGLIDSVFETVCLSMCPTYMGQVFVVNMPERSFRSHHDESIGVFETLDATRYVFLLPQSLVSKLAIMGVNADTQIQHETIGSTILRSGSLCRDHGGSKWNS